MLIPTPTILTYEDFMVILLNINPLNYTNTYVEHRTLVEFILIYIDNTTVIDHVFPYVNFSYFSKYIKNIKYSNILDHVLKHYVTNEELFCLVSDVLDKEDSILTKMQFENAYVLLDHLKDHQLFSESLIYLMDINPDEFVSYIIHIRQIDIIKCYCSLEDCTCSWILKNILIKCSFAVCSELFSEYNTNNCELICYITVDLRQKLDYFNATSSILTPRVLKDLIDKNYYANIAIIVLKYPNLIEKYKHILTANMYKFTSLQLLIRLGAPPSYIKLVVYEYSKSKNTGLLGEILCDEKLKEYIKARKMRSNICEYIPANYFTEELLDINNAHKLYYKFNPNGNLFKHCYKHICKYGTFKQFRKIVQFCTRYRRTFAIIAAEKFDIRKEYYYMHELKGVVKESYIKSKSTKIIKTGDVFERLPRRLIKFIPNEYMITLFLNAVRQRKHKIAKTVLNFINYYDILDEEIMEAIRCTCNPKILYKFLKKLPNERLLSPIIKEYAITIGEHMVENVIQLNYNNV